VGIDEAAALLDWIVGRKIAQARVLTPPGPLAPVDFAWRGGSFNGEGFDRDDLHDWHTIRRRGPWPQGKMPNGRVAYMAGSPIGVASLTRCRPPSGSMWRSTASSARSAMRAAPGGSLMPAFMARRTPVAVIAASVVSS